MSLDKTRPHQGAELAAVFAAHPAAAGMRHLLIADAQTNVQDADDVWWTVLNNIDPERDVRVMGELLTWDGTPKRPDEGFVRPWPPKIEMDAGVVRRVESLWHLYPLPERWRG